MSEPAAITSICALTALGLLISNWLVDRGMRSYAARRVPAVLGGCAYLLAVLWLSPWSAILLSISLTALLLAIRFIKRRILRGVQGSELQPWVEFTFLLAATASLWVGWVLMEDRWLAFVPIGFLAWGDTAGTLVSETLMRYGKRFRMWPSVGVMGACLAVAALYSPFWVAGTAALAATAAERFTPAIAGVRDDNWAIVGAALAVLVIARVVEVG